MKYLFLLLVLSACRNQNNLSNKIPDVKSAFTKMNDPFLQFIPDSLKHYISIFDTVFLNDQKYRSLNDNFLIIKYKNEQNKLDSINQIIVSNFLDSFGYLSMKQIGLKGLTAINSVIIHSPLNYQEKYFPLVVNAYINKKINGETLAMLEDRINMRNNRRQVYGTQVIQIKKIGKYTLYPVTNIDSVDIYRRQVGINMPIDFYLKQYFKTDWSIELYNKYLRFALLEFKVTDSPSLHIQISNELIK